MGSYKIRVRLTGQLITVYGAYGEYVQCITLKLSLKQLWRLERKHQFEKTCSKVDRDSQQYAFTAESG